MFQRVREDIRAVKERDPAATSTASVLLNYPGVHAIWWHRIDHWLWLRGRRGIARLLSQVTRFFTGIEVHPGAVIGERFFIDHGMGVVIGETTIIGNDVTLYQGVTLGGTGKETGKRHPTIEDCVVVGVGAAILGNITIGHGSRVGGGAVVIDDVPPNSTAVGIPARVVVRAGERVDVIDLHHEDLPDPVVEMFRCLTRRLERLEKRLSSDEGIGEERGEPVFARTSAPGHGDAESHAGDASAAAAQGPAGGPEGAGEPMQDAGACPVDPDTGLTTLGAPTQPRD